MNENGGQRTIRLLMLAPYPLFPTRAGGKIRIVEMARSLSELGVEVTVLAPFHFTQSQELAARENFKFHAVKYPFLLPFLFTNRPFPYEFLTSFHPGLAVLVKKFLRQYDIYQFEHCQFAGLLRHIPRDKIVVYDAHNVELDYVRGECKSHWAESVVARRVFRLEKQLARRANHVFACSNRDQARLSNLYGVSLDRISVAANGVKPVAVLPLESARRAALAKFPALAGFTRCGIYSGSNVAHNRAAVNFILRELAPTLSKEWAFVIHGSCGKTFGSTLANVFFDDSSEDITAYVGPQSVGLNPVGQGSGTNLKLIHYLNHTLPVVSTPFGMRGYDDLRPFVTIAPLEKFAAVLERGEFLRPLPPQQLEQQYGWSEIAAQTKTVYERLLSGEVKL